MAKRKKILFVILTLTIMLLANPTVVLAIPPLPSSFHGTVKVDGNNVADGTFIEALINNQVFAQGYTQTYKSDSVFVLNIPGDDGSTTAIDGGKDGDIVYFKVGGVQATQTGIWHSGTSVELNLSLSMTGTLFTPAPTPTPYPTQTPIIIVQNPESTQTPVIIVQNPESTQTPEIPQLTPEVGLTSTLMTSILITQSMAINETQTSIPPSMPTDKNQTDPALNTNDYPAGKSNNLTILIILIIVFVVVAGMGFGLWYFGRNK